MEAVKWKDSEYMAEPQRNLILDKLVKKCKQKWPSWVDKVTPQCHILLIENPGAYELLVREDLKDSQTIQAAATAVGCPQELDSKACFLRLPHPNHRK